MKCQLAEGLGVCVSNGGFGSVNGCRASDEKVVCGVLWRGDGRGGVFYHFSISVLIVGGGYLWFIFIFPSAFILLQLK